MKRITYAMVMAVALIVMVSSFAVAGGEECAKTKTKTAATQVKMGECCVTAAKAGEGCCGKDAEAVKATYASYQSNCSTAEKAACASSATVKAASAKAACAASCTEAEMAAYKAASADMHKCCATAVAAGEGCCGQEADALQASYEQKVAYYEAAAAVQADMHACCATAMAAGEGCCGHSPEEMKADFDKKVEAKSKKVATQSAESSDG